MIRRFILALGALLLSSAAQAQNIGVTCPSPNYYGGLFHPGCLAAADLNNNNAAIAASITTMGALKLSLTGGTLTGPLNGTTGVFSGFLTAATPATGTNSNVVATTNFVATNYAPIASPHFTGIPTGATAAPGTNTTQLATTAFVNAFAGGVYAPLDSPHFIGAPTIDGTLNITGTLTGVGALFTGGLGPTPVTAARVLATDTNTLRGLGDRAADILNAKDMGATGQAMTFSGAVMAASSTAVNIPGANFSGANITTPRQVLQLDGALGNAQAPLNTTIEQVIDAENIIVGTPSTHKTPASYAGIPTVITPGVTGTVTPGDTYTISGGTLGVGGAGTLQVSSTRVYGTPTVSVAGTGVNANSCIVQTPTGHGSPARIQFATTGVGGGLTGTGTIISGGHFFTNPGDITAVDVTGYNNCVIAGAKISVSVGADVLLPLTFGDYDVVPASPIGMSCLSCAVSNSGTTMSMVWNTTGTGIYGTDDSPAIAAATTKMVTRSVAGQKVVLYFPSGNYLLNSTALPLCNGVPCSFVGDASIKSILTIGTGYAGADLITSRNAWVGPNMPPTGASLGTNQMDGGLVVSRLSVVGNSYAPTKVNAIHLFDRNDFALIEYFDAFYVGSCIRAGEQFTSGVGNAVTRESRLFQVRCFHSGSETQPAILLTAQGPTTGGSDVRLTDIEILGNRGDGLVIQNEATASDMRNMFISGLRIEGTARRALDNKGDLLRFGIASNVGATIDKVYATNVFLSNPYAGYCAVRFAGNPTEYPNLISIVNAVQVSGSNGGDGICLDAGDDLYLDFNSLDAYGFEVTTGDAIGSGGAVGTRNIFNLHGRDSLYLWNLGTGVSVNIPPLVAGNPGLKTNYLAQSQAMNFTGGFQVAGSVPILPYGLLAKVTGVNMNTTADTSIPLVLGSATKYALGATTSIATTVVARLTNCSGAASTASGAIYTGASKSGTPFTPVGAFSTLSGQPTDMQNLAGTGGALTRTFVNNPLFFSLTVAQGTPTTCDLYVYGNPMP